jgi:hypothetical protein
MPSPRVGYQPRNTPAERRAFFEVQRQLRAIYTDPDTFTDTVEVDIDDSTNRNYISNRTGTGNVDGAVHMSIRSAGTEIGRITRATSSTAGFLTTSDEDLKDNIAEVTDDLSMQWMRTIEPLFFNYRDRPDVRHVGYCAQRVAAAWPNGVISGVVMPGYGNVEDRTWDDHGNETTPSSVWQAWMMDHSKITPILHSCLRALDATIEERGGVLDDYGTRIAALEQTVVDQATQITALQADLDTLRVEIYYTRQMTANWQYSNTVNPPPGAGQMRTNAAFTEMYIHTVDDNGYNRSATLDAIVAFTALKPKTCRFRVRGTTGSVFELLSSGRATKTANYYTVPITVISGAAADKGFRVEITLLSQIWAEDPPPLPTVLPA